tara:strand:+ start:956 stop:1261 length:306 start_codon:yes stop_codon:yes gene_type:complete
MYYQIRKYKKDGEIIFPTKLISETDFPNAHPYHAEYQALNYFYDAKREARAMRNILASDRFRKNCTDAQLKSHYDNAIYKIEYVEGDTEGVGIVITENVFS